MMLALAFRHFAIAGGCTRIRRILARFEYVPCRIHETYLANGACIQARMVIY